VKLWWHRGRAIAWVVIGVAAFPLGWQDAIWLLWLASVYANAESAWSTGQAADHRDLTRRLDRIEQSLSDKDRGQRGNDHGEAS
jgi:hypothetical protein